MKFIQSDVGLSMNRILQ